MLATRSGAKCNHQPVHADCMAHQRCVALPGMERVYFLPELRSSHVHSRLASALGTSGRLWQMRGMEIKECMTGSADGVWVGGAWGGYSLLGAMQLQQQITYARERRADRGSVNHDNPNNVF